jgi:hypothetical protein
MAVKRLVPIAVILLATAVSLVFTFFQPSGTSTVGAQPQATCTDFPATKQMVCGRFLEYWQTNGGLAQFGYPISPEFTEKSDLNGNNYSVQYFERAVFESHPENKQPYDVLLSQLGTFQLRQKYPQGAPTASSVVAKTPVPALKGAEVAIGKDVVTTLIDQVQASTTGLHTGQCGTEMTWVLQTTNRGNASFALNLDKASLRMVDSTGKSYPLSPACGGQPYSGSFASPITLAAGDVHKGYVAFEVTGIPQGATYFDVYLVLSNTPVAFRYMLPIVR